MTSWFVETCIQANPMLFIPFFNRLQKLDNFTEGPWNDLQRIRRDCGDPSDALYKPANVAALCVTSHTASQTDASSLRINTVNGEPGARKLPSKAAQNHLWCQLDKEGSNTGPDAGEGDLATCAIGVPTPANKDRIRICHCLQGYQGATGITLGTVCATVYASGRTGHHTTAIPCLGDG